MQQYVGMTIAKSIQTRCIYAWQYAKAGVMT